MPTEPHIYTFNYETNEYTEAPEDTYLNRANQYYTYNPLTFSYNPYY